MVWPADDSTQSQVSISRRARPSKVRGAMLPQEYELVRLFADVKKPDSSWNVNTPACEWYGIKWENRYSTQVYKINLKWFRAGGELHLTYLPYTVTYFCGATNDFTGTVCLDSLPPSLEYLNLATNHFTGPVNLTSLPQSLLYLYLEENNFSGDICLSQLPRRISHICLNNNTLTGKLELQHLPPTLHYLGLSANLFRGYLNFDSLHGILSLYLDNNEALHGELRKEDLPWGAYLSVRGTGITLHRRKELAYPSKRKVHFPCMKL